MKYKRVLLKLSGEVLGGQSGQGLDPGALSRVARELKEAKATGAQIAVVVGGGNFFRGLSEKGHAMNRVSADYIGMLGTVMNALALKDFLEGLGVEVRVMSAVEMPRLASLVQPLKAVQDLEKGRIVIFAGGTGHPFFSTDTTAALRASEIQAEVVMKGTKVDGVYTADPMKDPAAKRLPEISYEEVLAKDLKVMDLTAVTMCRQNGLKIMVFNMREEGNIAKVLRGEAPCSVIG
jgi:uridylate kinase